MRGSSSRLTRRSFCICRVIAVSESEVGSSKSYRSSESIGALTVNSGLFLIRVHPKTNLKIRRLHRLRRFLKTIRRLSFELYRAGDPTKPLNHRRGFLQFRRHQPKTEICAICVICGLLKILWDPARACNSFPSEHLHGLHCPAPTKD